MMEPEKIMELIGGFIAQQQAQARITTALKLTEIAATTSKPMDEILGLYAESLKGLMEPGG